MAWYIFIAALVLFMIVITHVCRTRLNISKLTFICICFILFFFMAFRADTVGADTINYVNIFRNINYRRLDGLLYSNVNLGDYYVKVENGYALYNIIINFFSDTPHTITFVNSLLIIVLLFAAIKNQSPDILLSIWLYITLGVFQTEMNMARNAIGILLCYIGFKYIKERNFIKYLIIVLLATSFHFTSIIFIPLYWLAEIKLSAKNISIGFIVITAVSMASSIFKRYLMFIVPTAYRIYFEKETINLSSYILGIFYLILIVFVICCIDSQKRLDSINSNGIGSWAVILNLAFFYIGYNFDFGTRVAALFGPYLIIFIPQIINLGINNKNKKNLITWSVYILCGVQYIMRLTINNIGSTMPYQFY